MASEGAPLVRPEQPRDHEAVHALMVAAFGRDAEGRLVRALRLSPAFIPELSLVAVERERVVGHVLFTRLLVRGAVQEFPGLGPPRRAAV